MAFLCPKSCSLKKMNIVVKPINSLLDSEFKTDTVKVVIKKTAFLLIFHGALSRTIGKLHVFVPPTMTFLTLSHPLFCAFVMLFCAFYPFFLEIASFTVEEAEYVPGQPSLEIQNKILSIILHSRCALLCFLFFQL